MTDGECEKNSFFFYFLSKQLQKAENRLFVKEKCESTSKTIYLGFFDLVLFDFFSFSEANQNIRKSQNCRKFKEKVQTSFYSSEMKARECGTFRNLPHEIRKNWPVISFFSENRHRFFYLFSCFLIQDMKNKVFRPPYEISMSVPLTGTSHSN